MKSTATSVAALSRYAPVNCICTVPGPSCSPLRPFVDFHQDAPDEPLLKGRGADVDLVGPGAAYEKWKKTPEYQEWRKRGEQIKQGP